MQICKAGVYKTMGMEFDLSRDVLAQMVANFKLNVKKYADGEYPIDFAHDNGQKAAGWFKELVLNDQGELWANKISWTPSGKQSIQDREFKYASIDAFPEYTDNETGEYKGAVLNGFALTNIPLIKGMKGIMMSSDITREDKQAIKSKFDSLIKAGASADDAVILVYSLYKNGKLSEGEDMTDLEKANAKIKELETQLSSEKANTEKAQKDLSDVKAEVTKLSADVKLAEKTKLFDKMLSEGNVCEAQREPFMKEDTVKFAENAKKLNPGNGKDGSGGDDKTAQEEVMEKASEYHAKNAKISFSDAVMHVLHADKELANKYNEATKVR